MSGNDPYSLQVEERNIGFIKRNLADLFTLSRVIIALIILFLGFVGKSAYLSVVILTLVGAATDILDGKAARRYLGNREGRLGKHDIEIDTFFLLCVLGYLSLAEVVIHRTIGLGWIGLSLTVILLSKRNLKVLIVSEVTTVIALLVITLIHNPLVFGLVIVPIMTVGLFINRRRVLYLLFEYWPSLFSR